MNWKMASNAKPMAILFVDICDSTKLFERIGDTKALAMTSRCIRAMEQCVASEGGIVQQAQGDGLLCTFNTAEAALQAAEDIQNNNQTGPLSLHAGLDFGPVILQGGAIFGNTVNVAARMLEIAKKGETIISEDAWRELSEEKRESLRTLGRVSVKGKSQLIKIFLAVPVALDQTVIQRSGESTQTSWPILEIDDGTHRYQIEASVSNFVMGRHHDCDLIIDQKFVSRHHATIECMRGKFFLVDHSTNGSYVSQDNQVYIFLRREMLQLHGQGVICLGVDPHQNSDHLIWYKCDDSN
jgi:class 3 adenylate cyclase